MYVLLFDLSVHDTDKREEGELEREEGGREKGESAESKEREGEIERGREIGR